VPEAPLKLMNFKNVTTSIPGKQFRRLKNSMPKRWWSFTGEHFVWVTNRSIFHPETWKRTGKGRIERPTGGYQTWWNILFKL